MQSMGSCYDDDGQPHEVTFREELTKAVLLMLDQFLIGYHPIDESGEELPISDEWILEAFALSLDITPAEIGTDAPWPDLSEKSLLVALVLLVERYFRERDGELFHTFMSAEQKALNVLVHSGLMLPVKFTPLGQPHPWVVGGRWSEAGETFRRSIWHRGELKDWIEADHAKPCSP